MRLNVADVRLPAWKRESLACIERQAKIVAALVPGSQEHRRATQTLLTLQDCLHTMTEAKAMIEGIRQHRAALAILRRL